MDFQPHISNGMMWNSTSMSDDHTTKPQISESEGGQRAQSENDILCGAILMRKNHAATEGTHSKRLHGLRVLVYCLKARASGTWGRTPNESRRDQSLSDKILEGLLDATPRPSPFPLYGVAVETGLKRIVSVPQCGQVIVCPTPCAGNSIKPSQLLHGHLI